MMPMLPERKASAMAIMDYYRMRNLQADTSMRETIADPGEQKKE